MPKALRRTHASLTRPVLNFVTAYAAGPNNTVLTKENPRTAIAIRNRVKSRSTLFILSLLGSVAAALATTLAILLMAIVAQAAPAPKGRLTKSETRAALQASAQTQEVISRALIQLQKLKANHIAKTKLASADDKLVANIYDRLISAIESRYKSGDIADFLNKYSLQMAETEKRNNSNLTAFFSYLGDVVKSAKNDRADLVSTIEKYIRSAPVSDPLSAVRFILNNSYSNGSKSEFAVGSAREDAVPDSPFVEVKKEDQESILPVPLTPYLLPPQETEIEVVTVNEAPNAEPAIVTPPVQSASSPAANIGTPTASVAPAAPVATDKVNKTNEPVPEKTPPPSSPTPSSDSSAPGASPSANNPSVG